MESKNKMKKKNTSETKKKSSKKNKGIKKAEKIRIPKGKVELNLRKRKSTIPKKRTKKIERNSIRKCIYSLAL